MMPRLQKSVFDPSRVYPVILVSPSATLTTTRLHCQNIHNHHQQLHRLYHSQFVRQQQLPVLLLSLIPQQQQRRKFHANLQHQKLTKQPIERLLWYHQRPPLVDIGNDYGNGRQRWSVSPRICKVLFSTDSSNIDDDKLDFINGNNKNNRDDDDVHGPEGGGQRNEEGGPTVTAQYEPKPWFDTNRSLDVRINELLDVDTLHPADIVHPMMEDLIKQCCYKSTIEGMQRGQEILDRCFVEKRRYQMTADLKLFVPQKLLQILLFGWCKIAHKEVVAQSRMKEIIQLAIEEGKMDDTFLHTKLSIPRTKRIASEVYPTVYLFNTYMIGLGNAAKITPQAALDSEAVLYEMIEYNRMLGWHTKPNTRTYTHVIVAYANTKHVAAGRRAYKILQQIKTVHAAELNAYEEKYQQLYNFTTPKENKHQIVTPDAVAYTATLKALQIANRSPELVMDLLNETVDAPGVVLDAMLFVVTIKSLSSIIDHETHALKRMELASEAERILRTMIQYSTTKGFQARPVISQSSKTMNHGMDEEQDDMQYENNDSPVYDHDENKNTNTDPIQPQLVVDDSSNDNTVGIDETGTNDTLPQQLLQSDAENRKSLRIGYNACIHAWAQSYCYEGAPHCEKLLQEMLDSTYVQPDTTTFNTCYLAWSKSQKFHMDAGERAIALLNRQFDLSSSDQIGDNVKPDFQSFTSCILVLSKSKDNNRIQNALALLQKLLEQIKLGSLSITRNPTAPFSAVLTTIANYKLPTKSNTETTEEDSSDIDVFSSTVDVQSDPYSIAINIYDQIEKDAHGIGTTVDHHCVTAFLKCIVAHSIPGSTERDHTSRRVFHDTCQAGHVSRPVLKEFQTILGPAAQEFPDLRSPPKFWSRNVTSTFR